MITEAITFVSHTNKPGGAELGLRRYLETTAIPTRLVTMEPGGVWNGLKGEVVCAPNIRALRKEISNARVVVANSMRAALFTALVVSRNTKLVYYAQDGLKSSAMSPLSLSLTKQATARRVDFYLTNSQWTASTLRDALHVGEDRIHVIYTMSGTGRRPANTKRATSSRLRLLFLGRITPWKGPHVAVRALDPLRSLGIEPELTIVGGAHFGERRYLESLRELVATEPAARIVGHVEDVWGLLDSHDLLIHCSTVPEPFGQVIIQGLASGIPVVATGHGGPMEILSGSPVPLLYRPGDPDELARAIKRATDNYAELTKWGTSRAVMFSDEHVAKRTDLALETIYTRAKPSRR